MPPKSPKSKSGSGRIREPTEGLGDWRGEIIAEIRRMIREADPEIVEERKWRKPSNPSGVPVWSHDGILCTGEIYSNHVRLTFPKGASLQDPKGLFNASLEGNSFRAIVIHEADTVREGALKDLIRKAVALNEATASKRRKLPRRPATRGAPASGDGSERTRSREGVK